MCGAHALVLVDGLILNKSKGGVMCAYATSWNVGNVNHWEVAIEHM